MNHNRLDQLADGIFAIVMTILVFDIRIPIIYGQVSNATLWFQIKQLSPVFLSYLLSFSLLFTYWRAFFMLISLIPFSASLLGQYNRNELSVVIFSVHTILIGLTLYWMRRYVFYSEHIKNPEITKREIRGSTVRTLVPVFFAIIAILLCFWSIKISLVLLTLAVLFNLSSYSTRLFENVLKFLHKLFFSEELV